jgi:hypothetical protein
VAAPGALRLGKREAAVGGGAWSSPAGEEGGGCRWRCLELFSWVAASGALSVSGVVAWGLGPGRAG